MSVREIVIGSKIGLLTLLFVFLKTYVLMRILITNDLQKTATLYRLCRRRLANRREFFHTFEMSCNPKDHRAVYSITWRRVKAALHACWTCCGGCLLWLYSHHHLDDAVMLVMMVAGVPKSRSFVLGQKGHRRSGNIALVSRENHGFGLVWIDAMHADMGRHPIVHIDAAVVMMMVRITRFISQ